MKPGTHEQDRQTEDDIAQKNLGREVCRVPQTRQRLRRRRRKISKVRARRSYCLGDELQRQCDTCRLGLGPVVP